jgi:hypothetical protein
MHSITTVQQITLQGHSDHQAGGAEMNMQTTVWRLLHDALMKEYIGEEFAHAIRWCEDFIDNELAFVYEQDNPAAAVRQAIKAYKKEHRELT